MLLWVNKQIPTATLQNLVESLSNTVEAVKVAMGKQLNIVNSTLNNMRFRMFNS